MIRNFNTKRNSSGFDNVTIEEVWRKGKIVNGYDPNLTRQDKCGALINRNEYGQLTSRGWEIDHIDPVSNGGSDNSYNLQPLHWRNNRAKGDSTTGFDCAVTQ